MNDEDGAKIPKLPWRQKQGRTRQPIRTPTSVVVGGSALLFVIGVMLLASWGGITAGRDLILGGPKDYAELAGELRNKGLAQHHAGSVEHGVAE